MSALQLWHKKCLAARANTSGVVDRVCAQ